MVLVSSNLFLGLPERRPFRVFEEKEFRSQMRAGKGVHEQRRVIL